MADKRSRECRDRYGSVGGLGTEACEGACDAGHFCPSQSTSARGHFCPAGRYGASSGLGSAECSGPCLAGFFCPLGSTSAMEHMCCDLGLPVGFLLVALRLMICMRFGGEKMRSPNA